MNVADTEQTVMRLKASGYKIATSTVGADVVILNTCSIRARAEQKVFSRIGQIRNERKSNPPVIGVMGCIAQLEGQALLTGNVPVSLVVGTRAKGQIAELIGRVLLGEEKVCETGDQDRVAGWNVTLVNRSSPYIAYVPIIEGCNKFCTYCIVPFSRGREQSRPAVDIIAEINTLKEGGYTEVHLIGQNVNSYRPKVEAGLESVTGATPFSRLLRAVAATRMRRIKYTTSFPRDFHSDILQAMDENENLCEWVHLPVQSGSNTVLRRMRRGYTADDYMRRVESIKTARRRYALTTDLIVGFPGETAEEFAETLHLVKQSRFDGAYLFKYSKRKGTPSAKLSGEISEDELTRRFDALEHLQRRGQNETYESYIGRTVSVLVTDYSSRSESDITGHTTCHKVVNLPGTQKLIGQVVDVKIVAAKHNSLYGQLC